MGGKPPKGGGAFGLRWGGGAGGVRRYPEGARAPVSSRHYRPKNAGGFGSRSIARDQARRRNHSGDSSDRVRLLQEALTAMKEGAFDFLQKPVDLHHLKLHVQRAPRQQELLRQKFLNREE